VSEFNQPWPNTYGAESDPTLAVIGAFQDWDSIMHFAYSHGRSWDAGVPNGFNINGDWSKWANIGQSAWLFRTGAVRPGLEPVEIPLALGDRLQATREKRNGNIGAFLSARFGYDSSLALVHPVRLVRDGEGAMPETGRLEGPYRADSGEFTYDRAGRMFLIHSPYAAGVFGFAGKEAVGAGAIDVQLASSARGFAALLVTPLDGRTIAESERLLVSNPGYTLRSQPGADPPRPQMIVNYPGTSDWYTIERDRENKPSGDLNGGRTPTWMERVEAFLTLRTRMPEIAVYPLDGAGNRLARLAEPDVERTGDGFRIHLQAEGQAPAMWYEIVPADIR
jgi:hypothetical protein